MRADGSITDSFEIRIRINNTNRAICEAAKIAANAGYVGARKPWSGARAHHKQLFCWQISNRAAAKVLSDIRPFLVAKQEQADLALQFQELLDRAAETHRQAGLGWRYGFAPHSEDELGRRRDFQEKMKALNFRGLPRPENETG